MRKAGPSEIVFVLFGLIVLAGLMLTVFGRAHDRRRSPCLRNLKELGFALSQYGEDFGGRYPWEGGSSLPPWTAVGKLHPRYLAEASAYRCPDSRDRKLKRIDCKQERPLASFRESDVISYGYCFDARGPDNAKPWTEKARSTVRLMADKKAGLSPAQNDPDIEKYNHKDDGRNVLYHDLHVKWKAGIRALDPDAMDDEVGAPDAADYRAWWSDPPFYGE